MTDSRPDYYALLGVTADADGEAIRAAYRALAKQHHPDVAGDEDSQAAERFLEIQEAYDVLGDANRRAQYDLERARQRAREEALRWQRDLAATQFPGPALPGNRGAMRPASAFHPRRKLSTTATWLYLGAIFLVVVAAGLVIDRQRQQRLALERERMAIVEVDGSRPPGFLDEPRRGEKGSAGLRPGLGTLLKEVEEFDRWQAERAKAAGSRAEGASAEKKTASSTSPAPEPSQDARRKVDCSGEGRRFSVIHDNDIVSVSYNGGPLVRPTIRDQGTGMVVMSQVEPTNRVSIGFMKGDKDGTIVVLSDAVGNVFRTFGVDCSAAAF